MLKTTDDFAALKWFHDNGVPQVIQTNRIVFDVFGADGAARLRRSVPL